jgi:hypothetical protein
MHWLHAAKGCRPQGPEQLKAQPLKQGLKVAGIQGREQAPRFIPVIGVKAKSRCRDR